MIARLRAAAGLAALAVAAGSLPAAAGDAAPEAQHLFLEGMKLMGKKQYAAACEKLARSQELDPGMGTQFRLAECYEKLGRAASAFAQYADVADAALAAGKPDREAAARKRAAALEARIARLTITIPPAVAAVPGLEVGCDGAPVERALWGSPMPVDPGDHLVTVKAPGKKPWEGKVWGEAGAKLVVGVGALEDVAVPPVVEAPRSKTPALVLGAAGGLGLVLGVSFAAVRGARAGRAHALHDQIRAGGGSCVGGGTTDVAGDCASLASATSAGDAFGTASVVAFALGGAAIAAMATYLLLPASKPARPAEGAVRWSPVAGAGWGGLVVAGSL